MSMESNEMTPKANCQHDRIKTESKLTRLTDENGNTTEYRLDLSVTCLDCHQPFQFIGLNAGYSPDEPTVDFQGITLSCPVKPV